MEEKPKDGQYNVVEHVAEGLENEALHARGLELWRSDRYHEALSVYESLYELELVKLGKQHPQTINTNENRAHLLHAVERYQEALDVFEDVVMERTLLFGREHTDTLTAKLSQAALLEHMGR
jgi:tetratricopeptide (TPR) repeat protein